MTRSGVYYIRICREREVERKRAIGIGVKADAPGADPLKIAGRRDIDGVFLAQK